MKYLPHFLKTSVLLCTPIIGSAANIVVDTLSVDEVTDGYCSIVEAIENANRNSVYSSDCIAGSGPDSIDLSGLSGSIITATSFPAITESLVVFGPGPDSLTLTNTTISGANTVFEFESLAEINADEYQIKDLTISNSNQGIRFSSFTPYSVKIENLHVEDSNFAIYFNTGGSYARSLKITDSDFINNGRSSTLSSNLGAIHLPRHVNAEISGSRFINNGSRRSGAALYLSSGLVDEVNDNNIVIKDSLFYGNNAGFGSTGAGGAVYITAKNIKVINSIFSNNEAEGYGGALYLRSFVNGNIDISNNDFIANTADTSIACNGGGVYLSASLAATNLSNNAFARNNDPVLTARGSNIGGSTSSITSRGYNFFDAESGTCSSIALTDIAGTTSSPKQPGIYDGSTLSAGARFTRHPGSPLIDAGDPSGCRDAGGTLIEKDIRGLNRPTDGDGDGVARCDIGAVEHAARGTVGFKNRFSIFTERAMTVNLGIEKTVLSPTTVQYMTYGGTATGYTGIGPVSGTDYTRAMSSVIWPFFDMSTKYASVLIHEDTVSESFEYFNVLMKLSVADHNNIYSNTLDIGPYDYALVGIIDDD